MVHLAAPTPTHPRPLSFHEYQSTIHLDNETKAPCVVPTVPGSAGVHSDKHGCTMNKNKLGNITSTENS